MKKALVILLTGVMMVAAVACSGGSNSGTATSAAPAAETPAAAEAEKPAEETAEEAVEEVEMIVPEEPMSYEDYIAAEIDSEVVIKGAVQAKQALYMHDDTSDANIYLQDENGGAYFLYALPCTEKEYEQIEVGKYLKVKGYKSNFSGEIEVVDAIWQFEDGEYIAEAEDVTDLLGTEELINKQNKFVVFKGVTIEPIGDNGDAYLYKWNGSGQEGDDLYFNVSVNGGTYQFTVESNLCGPDTEIYKAVKDFRVGDVVDLEGFLYWYEGPNPHITAILAQ